jgi:ATP-binding cassette, subfamily F, member 3
MISIKDLNFHIGERNLFDNISLSFPDKHRIALVGRNGEGKTTLLRLITSELTPSSGSISFSTDVKIAYLPQDLVHLSDSTVSEFIRKECQISTIEEHMRQIEEELKHASSDEDHEKKLKQYANLQNKFETMNGYTFDSRMKEVVMGLGFASDDLNRYCNEFSGGWKMRIYLAQILLNFPDILLLDEPTNHLDTESLEWLESYLIQFKGLLLIISHDRYFLDRLVDTTMELDQGKITIFPGTYSHYLSEKNIRKNLASKENERIERQIKQTQIFIERFRYKSTKSTQVQSRIKALEKLKAQCPTQEKERRSVKIKLSSSGRSYQEVVTMDKVCHAYGEKTVFTDLTLTVQRGDRIALVGKNGAGKSTFSRLISGKESPSRGNVKIAENTTIGFFAQESMQNLSYSNNVLQEVLDVHGPLKEGQIRDLLGAFLFSGDDIYKSVKVLSGGEKSRLALCKIMAQPFKVLVLDEPTNHLDENTKEAFHDALSSFDGTLIIVSHDRFFLDRLVNRVIEIKDTKAYDYKGNYTSFIDQRKQQSDEALSERVSLISGTQTTDDVKKVEEKDRKRAEAKYRQSLYQIKQDCKKIEDEIYSSENQKKSFEKDLCDPLIYQEPDKIKLLKNTIKSLEEHLESLYHQWHQAMEKVENF